MRSRSGTASYSTSRRLPTKTVLTPTLTSEARGGIHAERMSADEKARFKQALLSVTTALQFYARWP